MEAPVSGVKSKTTMFPDNYLRCAEADAGGHVIHRVYLVCRHLRRSNRDDSIYRLDVFC